MTSDPAERYQRIDRIATGGMGEVWRARDTILGREVAVKVLKQEYADDATFRARFAAEARHAAGLHHPNIASVFDYGEIEEGHTPYLVMELVEGQPLSRLLAGGRALDPEEARALVLQAADALGVAHAAGVVHRDVKPANLLVTPAGVLKITDFGIARAADQVAITQTGQIVGTPHYLSPEQASGETATPASDVYSLGVLLYECLIGQRPFLADTPVAIALAHIREEVPPLPETIPADLAAVTMRALAKDPAERYADGAELAAALRSATAPAPAFASPAAAGPEATQVLAPISPLAASTTSEQPVLAPPLATVAGAGAGAGAGAAVLDFLRDRRRWPLLAGAALALLLLVSLMLALPGADDEAPESPATVAETEPPGVRLDRDDFLGRPVGRVREDLRELGLRSAVSTKQNPGGEKPDTVADLSPTGEVEKGSRVQLFVWGPEPVAPPEEETETKDSGKTEKPEKAPKADKADKAGKSKSGKGKKG